MIIKGMAASQGIAEGSVKIVIGSNDISKFKEGDILVAEVTEPSMVLMMTMAAAIVTDKGGMTTHAAIVSRELGVPCVVGTREATTTLKDGMRVRVDGSAGTVEMLD